MHETQLKSTKTNTGETLCFDKNDFMKEHFSVDEFLHKNRNAPSLEQLRDNLGLYLKGLRACMIDLINEDYADFVNLSANLVGLDESIEVIQKPLEQFRDEIQSIQQLIDDNVAEIKLQLERKKQLRELKRNLQSLKKVYETTKKLEDLLAHQLISDKPEELRIVDMERAALELLQLRFNQQFCVGLLKDSQVSQIEQLQQQAYSKLRLLFNYALTTSNSAVSDILERSLRIYVTLDSCADAEKAFREDVVASYMNNTISESFLQNSPQGLSGVYGKILNFIPTHMSELLRLTRPDKLKGFNFIVNSFWIDVEQRLETHMPSIFAPGNSEVFYMKYKCTQDFLGKIEQQLGNEQAIKYFRQHKQTKSFLARWNLPVYFQIVFQDIAGKFESVLEPVLDEDTLKVSGPQDYSLKPFTSANLALKSCWLEGIYLHEVFPKFFKLTLQIVLRLSRWISSVMRLAITSNKNDFPAHINKINLLIILHTDMSKFLQQLPQLHQTIFQCLPKEKQICGIITDSLNKSFMELHQMLHSQQKTIQDALKSQLIVESGLETVKQVNDLPRLYRKTNREVPTRCSTYVEQMLKPIKSFAEQHANQLGSVIVKAVLAEVASKITLDYYGSVNDVLTSVQKTEESLRRLRNLKSGNAAITSNSSTTASSMSDDDKIRLQLRVDVATWTTELSNLNLMPTQIEKLVDLNLIVEESIKSKETN